MTDNNALSITELQQKAQEGDAQAQFELACRLSAGEGIEKNQDLAFQWLTSAAESGNSEAQLAIGLCFYADLDWELCFGVAWSKETKTLNNFPWSNPNTKSLVSNVIGKQGFDQNITFSWIMKSAEQNNGHAQYLLFHYYARGNGTLKNIELAFSWLIKAAENGVAEAEDMMGYIYESGKLVPKDEALAFNWFEKAASQGLAEAIYKLALCYLEGKGVEQNYAPAFDCLNKYVQQGEHESSDYDAACLLLGDLYAEGKGVLNSDEMAIHWYENVKERNQAELTQRELLQAELTERELLQQDNTKYAESLAEVKARLASIYRKLATNSELSHKEAYKWHKKAAENDSADSQYWLAMYYLKGGILEQSEETISDYKRYSEAWRWADSASANDCRDAELIKGFIDFFELNDKEVKSEAIDYFETAVGCSVQGVAEYFLAQHYQYSDNHPDRDLVKKYSQQADLEKVWNYYDIDELLELDPSLREKLAVLLYDSKLIAKNKELEQLNEQLRSEIKEKEKAHKALHEKEKEMLSFFTHTMRNALAAAPESLRQAIQLLGSDVYESDSKHYKAINKIASLFSTLTLTDCLIDTFKQSISDPQEFKQAWDKDNTGDATPKWVIASALRQSLNRIFFMSDASDLKKLLPDPDTSTIKTFRKSFIDEALPLDVDHHGVEMVYSWVKNHIQCIEASITDADKLKFGANRTRFSLLFAIISELILNALKYWDGEDKVQITWKLTESGYFVFSVRNHCKSSAMSNLAGTHKGLAFIKRLIELLGEQASFSPKTENGFFVAEFALNKSLFGDTSEHIMD